MWCSPHTASYCANGSNEIIKGRETCLLASFHLVSDEDSQEKCRCHTLCLISRLLKFSCSYKVALLSANSDRPSYPCHFIPELFFCRKSSFFLICYFPRLDGLPLPPPPALGVKMLDSWAYQQSVKAARFQVTLRVGKVDS